MATFSPPAQWTTSSPLAPQATSLPPSSAAAPGTLAPLFHPWTGRERWPRALQPPSLFRRPWPEADRTHRRLLPLQQRNGGRPSPLSGAWHMMDLAVVVSLHGAASRCATEVARLLLARRPLLPLSAALTTPWILSRSKCKAGSVSGEEFVRIGPRSCSREARRPKDVWDAPFWSRGRKASSSRRPSSCSSSAAQETCRSASAPQPSSSSRSTSRASLTPAVRTKPGPTRTATSCHGSTVASLTGGAPRINHGGAIVGIGYETGTCTQSGEGSNNFVVGGSTPVQASPVTRTAAQNASTSTPQ